MEHRALFLTNWFPTKKKPFEGPFIREHALTLNSLGVPLMVVYLDVAKGRDWIKVEQFEDAAGFAVTQLKVRSIFWKVIHHLPILQFFLLRLIRTEIKEFAPTRVHSNVIYPSGHVGHWLAKSLGVKHIVSMHWSLAIEQLEKSAFSRKVLREALFVLPVSNFLKSLIAPFTSGKKAVVVSNVVDEDMFSLKHTEHREELVFLAVANWNRTKRIVKRPELILESIELLAKEIDRPIVLNFIGGGNLINELKKRSEKLSFQVNFLGPRPKKIIAQSLHEATFFVHASEIETFSVVISEALMTGTPVIASNRGAIPELINDENGVLCENDLSSWHTAMRRAITKEYDSMQIRSDHVARFGKSRVAESLSNIYE